MRRERMGWRSSFPRPEAASRFVGCGTSCYIGQAFASLRESKAHGETDGFAASEVPLGRRYDYLLAFSRSGN
jgi:fructoselysine-6-P-deglycase FrlB-like protein